MPKKKTWRKKSRNQKKRMNSCILHSTPHVLASNQRFNEDERPPRRNMRNIKVMKKNSTKYMTQMPKLALFLMLLYKKIDNFMTNLKWDTKMQEQMLQKIKKTLSWLKVQIPIKWEVSCGRDMNKIYAGYLGVETKVNFKTNWTMPKAKIGTVSTQLMKSKKKKQ